MLARKDERRAISVRKERSGVRNATACDDRACSLGLRLGTRRPYSQLSHHED